ncbi:MAG: hypothetical protein IJC48_12455 [Clostridia bacterium]|nr:hypothetical protein [Clostridia bacterium]
MPNTKITKQKWKDHYSYSKKIYFFGILVAVGVASLIFSVTRYIPDNAHAVLIQFVDAYINTTNLEEDIQPLLEIGQEYDETLEEIQFLSINYTGEGTSENDYYGAQVYSVQIYAGDNDIFIQNEKLTQSMIDQGFLMPLEELDEFAAFNAKYPDAVLWREEPSEEGEEEDEDAPARPVHAYAVDISSMYGLAERGAYDMREKYAGIMVTSENASTSFHVLSEMFEYFKPSEPIPVQENAEEAIDETQEAVTEP